MVKYTNGETVVNAMQFTNKTKAEIWSWISSFEEIPGTIYIWNSQDPYLAIHGEDGDKNAYFGDWIVEDSENNFHVVNDASFYSSYIKVSDEDE